MEGRFIILMCLWPIAFVRTSLVIQNLSTPWSNFSLNIKRLLVGWCGKSLSMSLTNFEESIEENVEKIKQSKSLKKSFGQYCDKLPVPGFNSQWYDISLIHKYLPSSLSRLDPLQELVIKKDTSYMVLSTETL